VQEDINAVRRVGRGEVGTLNSGFAGSAMLTVLPEVIRAYRKQFPDVRLTLREMVTSVSLEQLREGTIDLGFLRDPGAIEGYVIESLLSEPYIAVLPAKHRLAAHKSISVAKLKGEPLIFYGRKEGPVAYDKTIALCERAGFRPEISPQSFRYSFGRINP
jgi:DNA-binding transcriptional LysR family regulator